MRTMLGLLVAVTMATLVLAQAANAPAGAHGQMGKNMPDEPKQHCKMMMKMNVKPGDPAAMIALKEDLKLTDEQVQKLQGIIDKARQDAKALLKPEQVKTLEAMPEMPENAMAMHEQMMQQHGAMAAGGEMGMSCPMMDMMKGEKSGDKPAAGHDAQH